MLFVGFFVLEIPMVADLKTPRKPIWRFVCLAAVVRQTHRLSCSRLQTMVGADLFQECPNRRSCFCWESAKSFFQSRSLSTVHKPPRGSAPVQSTWKLFELGEISARQSRQPSFFFFSLSQSSRQSGFRGRRLSGGLVLYFYCFCEAYKKPFQCFCLTKTLILLLLF